mmetsp:Transcript_5031/g.17676  ORF Transcript_5031/g.17676 Transcript_5031/m.17676 type:complete len:218 (-) Transcript_5031:417-1070(-)
MHSLVTLLVEHLGQSSSAQSFFWRQKWHVMPTLESYTDPLPLLSHRLSISFLIFAFSSLVSFPLTSELIIILESLSVSSYSYDSCSNLNWSSSVSGACSPLSLLLVRIILVFCRVFGLAEDFTFCCLGFSAPRCSLFRYLALLATAILSLCSFAFFMIAVFAPNTNADIFSLLAWILLWRSSSYDEGVASVRADRASTTTSSTTTASSSSSVSVSSS